MPPAWPERILERWRPASTPAGADDDRCAIIDIGSNSIRLVVYHGRTRMPETMFNEKVMAGLGRGLAANGRLSDNAMDVAVAGLRRFAALTRAMGVANVRTVATAAVREARNGHDFIDRVAAECGLAIEVIDGEAEARAAAMGLVSGIPLADGVVGDLGGGSLELIRVSGGEMGNRISLPIGALRLDAVRKRDRRALAPFIAKALDKVDWAGEGKGRPFYTVGGSWRALAQIHIWMTGHPLPIVHQYEMPASAPAKLFRSLAHTDLATLKAVPHLSTSRLPSLPGAAMLLAAVVKKLGSSSVIASGFGLREGLLYADLPPEERALDPLIAAARAEGARQGRFAEHGDMLFDWMDPLFSDEPAGDRRLRLAACLLSDIAWRAHPDFRPERGVDVALHGNWVAVNSAERAALACALHYCFGGSPDAPVMATLLQLAPVQLLARARAWGLALRLGQRLTGGTAVGLAASRLERAGNALLLRVGNGHVDLAGGDAVQRRLKLLGAALGLQPQMELS
ncbi:Ppx/GppA family phosphatase [Sandarakinorhabdus oryzae]|uniref:Ppx/GppA family phosphatase n=1 Tax=Sandarakinorhabdus oryzae TaxID=2675220 RepID=UPI0012E2E9E0|nr:Ppx/GppA family phosphatase [Sandarakinorhabdus oryzae]